MSKKAKGLIAVLLVSVLGASGYFLMLPKVKDSFVEKEISIKQADTGATENLTYEDSSGFRFNYSSDLKVEEIERDNSQVYSSLEITGVNPGKLSLRISDSPYQSLADRQKEFEKTNVLSEVQSAQWADLNAIAFSYGAPRMRQTAALDNRVLYVLEAPADSGYWEKNLETILASFEFYQSVFTEAETAAPAADSGQIILLEETLE